ncbi:hypothetical protein SDC9_134738 [bioreactor metagenome]|uniref:Uncharacterized protein n=1 Tax=bioreactor metagenome TaxID=1076179 RepID=A0A645DF24_9ZZZZ
MHSLFNLLQLHERFITTDEDVKSCLQMEIDYNTVLTRVESFREKSIRFLTNALEGGI